MSAAQIRRAGPVLNRALFAAMMACLGSIVLLTFLDVLGRHLMGRPIYGAHDVTEHLMAMIVFLGLPIVTLRGLHLTVDLFDRYLMVPALWPWQAVVAVLVAAMLAFIGWTLLTLAGEAAQFREMSIALNVPRPPFYLGFAASAFVSAVAALVRGGLDASAQRQLRRGGVAP